MKVYLITEQQMEKLLHDLQLEAMVQANVLGQRWNTQTLDPKDSTACDLWRAYNFVVCRWRSEISK